MSIRINNNMMLWQASHQINVNAGKKAKVTEKLSSGFRINKGADDGAGLGLSEEMRRMVRGLNKGTQNAKEGIAWVQTGDGCLNEVHDILQRMNELTVKSLSETNSNSDRVYMQGEFDQLQSELDRLTEEAKFNNKYIFNKHESPYYQFEGNIKWLQDQYHVITAGENDKLVVDYVMNDGTEKTATITIPAGLYTTQELVDEIDDALEAGGYKEDGLALEFTEKGFCNINLEGGPLIKNVSGELAYLLYDSYSGGSLGALIGTTAFMTDYDELIIVKDENDELEFTIESTDGSSTTKKIKLDPKASGGYTRQELIDELNDQLVGTTVKATKYGTGIKLASDDSIITALKGNMFKIDSGEKYDSVFYDNVKYGTVTGKPAYLEGGLIVPTDAKDIKYSFYDIQGSNNTLVFKTNDGSDVTITIPSGKYTVEQMVTELNNQFQFLSENYNLGLEASVCSSKDNPPFQGIRIETTTDKGPGSQIGIVKESSTAYETLFVKHGYMEWGTAELKYDTQADKMASLTSGKTFSSDTLPLNIEKNKNDKFQLSLTYSDGSAEDVMITLSTGIYSSISEICGEIERQLNGIPADSKKYKGLLEVVVNADRIVIQENGKKPELNNITVSKVSGNKGWEELFVGSKSVPADGYGSATLNTPINAPMTFDDNNYKFTIDVDGEKYEIELPKNEELSQDEIKKIINNSLKEQQKDKPPKLNTFSSVTGQGDDNNVTAFGQGSTSNYSPDSFNVSGECDKEEGLPGVYKKNEPASVPFKGKLPEKIEIIPGKNDYFQCEINGKTISFNIPASPAGGYDRKAFEDELQALFDAKCGVPGEEFGGVIVNVDSYGALRLTAGLKRPGRSDAQGNFTNIVCNTNDSSFLRDLYAGERSATMDIREPLKNPITIGGSNDVFSFILTENNVTNPVNQTLKHGTYTPEELAKMMNELLEPKGVRVQIYPKNSGCLQLETVKKGLGNRLSYNSGDGGSSAEALFGERKTAAKGETNIDMQESIMITDSANKFELTIGGKTCSITLDARDTPYTRDELITMINGKLAADETAKAVGLEVKKGGYSGNRLCFETSAKGTQTADGTPISFRVTYSYAEDSAMKAIFGTTPAPEVSADFTTDGRLQITTDQKGAYISVSSSSGGAFQQPELDLVNKRPIPTEGHHSTLCSYIQGVSLASSNGTVEIDEWNKNLTFYFYDNTTVLGNAKLISFELDTKKSYSYKELEDMLQEKIDAAAGKNSDGTSKMAVSVTESGVKITVNKPGSLYSIRNFSGGFYDRVICAKETEKVTVPEPNPNPGWNDYSEAYTVGRKDVKNEITKIQTGVNDILKFEITYGGESHPIEMTLDAGAYDGEALVEQIQSKLNEQLEKMGLPINMVKVGIGGIQSGTFGSNDANALNFRLSNAPDMPMPEEGTYVISGVSGTAAFSVFYQTEGDITRAYVTGTKDISNGVTIKEGENDFSVKVSNLEADPHTYTTYPIMITPGNYTAEGISEELNRLFKENSVPLSAEIVNGNLELLSTKYGKQIISDISGSAKKELFFSENSDVSEDSIRVQLSSSVSDYLTIDRPVVSTVSLGINSVSISQTKYAQKALVRVKEAIKKVSAVRSYFGAMQNRLEHSQNDNEIKEEKTTEAESRIRDTDMDKTAVENANQAIIGQASNIVMNQANRHVENIMKILLS